MNPSSLPVFFCFTLESLLIVFYNVIVIHMIVFTLDIHYNPLKKDFDVMTPFQRLNFANLNISLNVPHILPLYLTGMHSNKGQSACTSNLYKVIERK